MPERKLLKVSPRLFALSFFAALFAVVVGFMAQPSKALAGACETALQGRVAWNNHGNRNWNARHLARLCAGVQHSEPARCYQRVMHGKVNWGGGTRWRWGNATNLCSGSRNAKATISCFRKQVAKGLRWKQAINSCNVQASAKRPKPLPKSRKKPQQNSRTPAAHQSGSCKNALQGRIAWNNHGNRNWTARHLARLCAGVRHSEPARCYQRVMHGKVNWGGGTRWRWGNTTNLCAGSRNAKATISCFKKQVAKGLRWKQAINSCTAQAMTK